MSPDDITQAVLASEGVARYLQGGSGELTLETRQLIEQYLDELRTTQRYRFYRALQHPLYPILRKVRRITEGIEVAQGATRGGHVVYVSNHKSHLDYLIEPLVLDDHGIRPPLIAAGINLFGGALGLLHRHVTGAIPIRRNSKDPVYLVTLRAYVTEVLKQRDVLYYAEGGRSYSGELKPPKTGLLQAALHADRQHLSVLPMAVAYDLVLEAGIISRQPRRGGRKTFAHELAEMARHAVGYHSRAFITFGRPIPLAPFDPDARRDVVHLAREVRDQNRPAVQGAADRAGCDGHAAASDARRAGRADRRPRRDTRPGLRQPRGAKRASGRRRRGRAVDRTRGARSRRPAAARPGPHRAPVLHANDRAPLHAEPKAPALMLDHVSRAAFSALASSRTLRVLASRYGMRHRNGFARRFIAGETIDEAIDAARALEQAGLLVTVDHLGEHVTSSATAAQATRDYTAVVGEMARAGIGRNLSVKLTQLGIDVDPATSIDNLRRVLDAADGTDFFIRLDMEGSKYTAPTLDVFETLWGIGYRNIGVVIQSYLRRSAGDVARVNALGARVRLVKGAYNEPRDVAYQHKAEVDAAFVELMKSLLVHGTYPAIATHDPAMIAATKAFAEERQLDLGHYEFQMLYGIRRDLQASLAAEGHPMRVYVPFGRQWFPYFMRRLGERPANLRFVLKNLGREGRSQGH